jgi:hypothetical protein
MAGQLLEVQFPEEDAVVLAERKPAIEDENIEADPDFGTG